MIDGDTFLGTYATVVVRESPAVMVYYKQSQRTAKADERATGLVARELLGSLVRDDLAKGRRSNGPPHRHAPIVLAPTPNPRDFGLQVEPHS